jgi:hypothetical protein
VKDERGSVLVEFAIVSFVLYLLLAASIDFGRLMFSAQALQDAARVAAREIALTPLPAACPSLADALSRTPECVAIDPSTGAPVTTERIFNPACLIVDLNTFAGTPAEIDLALDEFFRDAPLLNKALRPFMFVDRQTTVNVLRYPGALIALAPGEPAPSCGPHASTPYRVGIPTVRLDADGGEIVGFVDLIEEIRDSGGASPFSVANQGIVALRLNYPYQAAMMTAFKPAPPTAEDPLPSNVGNPIETDEDIGDPKAPIIGPYTGPNGLGRQLAFGGRVVRPFRKLLSAQAIYRREVFQ